MSGPAFVCICEREWCRCTNRVATQGATCFMCLEGSHQELRSVDPLTVDEEPWTYPPVQPASDFKPGACGPILLMALACWGAVIALIWVARRLVG